MERGDSMHMFLSDSGVTIRSLTRKAGEPLKVLLKKLEGGCALSDDDRHAIRHLPIRVREVRAGQDITLARERLSRCCFVLQGMTCAYKMARDGTREIVSFNIPGDAPDLPGLYLPVLDISIRTITPCAIGFLQHGIIHELCSRHPRIAAALWRQTLIDAAIVREWITSNRRSAASRVAHLMCELVVRFNGVGLADGQAISFPITQAEIGDALD